MINKFLEKISPKWEIEFSKINWEWCFKISRKEAIENKTENIYFLGGVKQWLQKRASDKDIEFVSYIRFDLDIVKNVKKKFWIDLDIKWLDWEIDLVKYRLDNLDLWKDYSFLVRSGWWCHIYYCSDSLEITENFTHMDFSIWITRIYTQFNKIIENEYLQCDLACKNIARIMRLPWSINQKNWIECKIMYFQDCKSKLVDLIPKFAIVQKIENEKIANEEQQRRLEDIIINRRMNKLIYGKDESEKLERMFEIINKVPAWAVSEKLLPEYKIHNNGKNFISGRQGKGNEFKGFYYVEDTNSICNWWSSEYNYWNVNSCFSSANLVKNFYWYEWGEVIKWFKINFKLNI